MMVTVLLPQRTLLHEEAVDRVIAESHEGSFCLEPRHVDYAAPIVAGILTLVQDGKERFIGTGEGVLVKVADEVLVSVRDAVTGADLGQLEETIRRRHEARADRADELRQAAERLESTLVRRFIMLEDERREPA